MSNISGVIAANTACTTMVMGRQVLNGTVYRPKSMFGSPARHIPPEDVIPYDPSKTSFEFDAVGYR